MNSDGNWIIRIDSESQFERSGFLKMDPNQSQCGSLQEHGSTVEYPTTAHLNQSQGSSNNADDKTELGSPYFGTPQTDESPQEETGLDHSWTRPNSYDPNPYTPQSNSEQSGCNPSLESYEQSHTSTENEGYISSQDDIFSNLTLLNDILEPDCPKRESISRQPGKPASFANPQPIVPNVNLPPNWTGESRMTHFESPSFSMMGYANEFLAPMYMYIRPPAPYPHVSPYPRENPQRGPTPTWTATPTGPTPPWAPPSSAPLLPIAPRPPTSIPQPPPTMPVQIQRILKPGEWTYKSY